MNRGRKPRPLSERFWEKVGSPGPSGCRLWTAARDTHGYGLFRVGSRSDGSMRLARAHRIAFQIAHGRAPAPGMIVRHVCDTPACVTPDHLLEGTYYDNAMDCVTRDRHARKGGRPGLVCQSPRRQA